MFNDYEGKLRHEARYQELMTEAQGGWMIKAAVLVNATGPSRPAGLKRLMPLAWAVVAAGALALIAAALMTALNVA